VTARPVRPFAVAVVAACAVVAPLASPAQEPRATRVVTYAAVLPGPARSSGTCWTRSLAAPSRGDAYRCMAGNSIYDPCFVPPAQSAAAVCDVNPAGRGRGFTLRLTEPLPHEPAYGGSAPHPFLVELAGGEVCVPLTGTHALLGTRSIGYECSESRALRNGDLATGLLDESFVPGRVWHARKAVYRVGRTGRTSGTVSAVPLAAVWR
jgi:hypothetical protein